MKVNRLFDHLFFLRPMLHLPVWTIAIFGYYGNSGQQRSWFELVATLTLGSCIAGGVFVLNQIYDIESDRTNKKLFFLAEGIISSRTAWLFVICLNIAALIIGFALSGPVGILATLGILLGIFYSAPPVALKNRAWPAVCTNAVGHGTLIYLIGHCAAGTSWLTGLIQSLPYFFAVGAVYIGTTAPDVDGDRKTGKRTIAVAYGEKATLYFAISLYCLAVMAGLLLTDIPFLIASLAAGPFYFWAVIVGSTKRIFMAIKISVVTLSLVACYFFPPYLPFLIILIIATRAYHKWRFNLDYPAIK